MLNERIRDLRVSFGWSQVELARRLNVSKQAVSNWENNNIQPSIDILIHLSDIFGVTTDYLLGRDDVPHLNTRGLPPLVCAHLSQLIDDFRNLNQTAQNPDTPQT